VKPWEIERLEVGQFEQLCAQVDAIERKASSRG